MADRDARLKLIGPIRSDGYYAGRSTLGEFFQDDERYTTLGLWLEL